MKLPNEITTDIKTTVGFAWSIYWRFIFVMLLTSYCLRFISYQTYLIMRYFGPFLDMLAWGISILATTFWILHRNRRMTRVILMNKVDYKKLVDKNKVNDNVNQQV